MTNLRRKNTLKRKFSKILGVGVTLAMLTSLMVGAIPIAADVSSAEVTITDDDEVINTVDATYAFFFTIYEELDGDAVPEDSDTITITFPEDFTIGAPTGTIVASPGWIGGDWLEAELDVGGPGGDVPAFALNDDEDAIVITLDNANHEIGESAQVRIEITAGITNPGEPGTYTVTLETSQEDTAVLSQEFEIELLNILTPAGVVQVFNNLGYESATPLTGDGAINDAYAAAGDEFVISVGPGRYVFDVTVDRGWADVTIQSSAGADETTIVGDITINDAGVTLDGFTIQGTAAGIIIGADGDDVIIENNIFLEEDEDQLVDHMVINVAAVNVVVDDNSFTVEDGFTGIVTSADADGDDAAAEITDNDFNLDEGAIGIEILGLDTAVSENTFMGSSGTGIYVDTDASIADNTFDGLEIGVEVNGGVATVTIEGNTFQNCVAEDAIDGGAILVTTAVADVVINNNIFTANADYVLNVVANADMVFMNFNDILTDNTGDVDDSFVLTNAAGVVNVEANWWGDVAGPDEDIFNDADLFDFEPFLVAATSGDGGGDANTTAFDAEDDNGVTVTVTGAADGDLLDGDNDLLVVGSATYAANPAGTAPDGAIGFWDIFVGSVDADVTEITVRIYTDVSEDTEVYVWAEAEGEWLEVSTATPNRFGGFMSIVVDADSTPTIADLAGLPFVVVEPPADPALEVDQGSLVPVLGAVDVSINPNFTWAASDDADSYEFAIAEDIGRDNKFALVDYAANETLNGHVARGALKYSTTYYWKVRAVKEGTTAAVVEEAERPLDPDTTGEWAESFFTTMAEPEEVENIVLEPTAIVIPPAVQPDIILQQPDVIVQVPASPAPVQAIDPALMWVIIAVGAILIIAVIVLIVRTRRVA